MSDRTALVTGGTGFIGSRLLSALLADGWAVRSCGRRPRPDVLPADVEYQQVDLAEGDGLDTLVAGVTHLFHLAGASSSTADDDEMQRANVVATDRLLGAAAKADVDRVVHMSTTAVYGEKEQLPLPVREDVEPHPSRGYGKAKWGAEQAVWRHSEDGLPVVVLRPVSVYGPENIKLLASAILDVAIEAFAGLDAVAVPEEPIEQRLVHVDDLIAACLHVAAADAAVGRAFNVVNEYYPTSHEVARVVAGHFGLEIALEPDPDCGPSYDERKRIHGEMVDKGMEPKILLTEERFRFMRKVNRNNRLDVSALLSTGFQFQKGDLVEGIGDTIGWYRDHRWVI